MPKAKPELRPYYTVKHEFTEAQKRYEDAIMLLTNTVGMLLTDWREKIPAPLLEVLDKQYAEFRAAAYGDE